MAGRTEIDGDQIQDGTVTGSDVLDESIGAVDLNISDVASGIASDPTASATIADLAKYGQGYIYEENPSFSTNSGTFETVVDFSNTEEPGEYRVDYAFTTTNSKANTSNICRVTVAGVEIFSRTQNGDTSNSISSFKGDISHPGGILIAAIEVRRSAGNGNAIITDAKAEIWRTS